MKEAVDLRFTLMAELPNKNLHKFRGKLSLRTNDTSVPGNAVPENGGRPEGSGWAWAGWEA